MTMPQVEDPFLASLTPGLERSDAMFGHDRPDDLVPAPLPAGWVIAGTPDPRMKVLSCSDDGVLVSGIWVCDPGQFRFEYACDETIHLITGLVDVRVGEAWRTLSPGCTAYFPRGTTAEWTVHHRVQKYFVLRNRAAWPGGSTGSGLGSQPAHRNVRLTADCVAGAGRDRWLVVRCPEAGAIAGFCTPRNAPPEPGEDIAGFSTPRNAGPEHAGGRRATEVDTDSQPITPPAAAGAAPLYLTPIASAVTTAAAPSVETRCSLESNISCERPGGSGADGDDRRSGAAEDLGPVHLLDLRGRHPERAGRGGPSEVGVFERSGTEHGGEQLHAIVVDLHVVDARGP